MNGYPKWFPFLLVATLITLVITGFLLAPNTLVMRLDFDLDWMPSGNFRHSLTALHAIAAYLMTVLLGALWAIHIRNGLATRRRRATGLPLAFALVFLAASGLGLYYFGGEQMQIWTAASHLAVGIALPVLYLVHKTLRERRRSR